MHWGHASSTDLVRRTKQPHRTIATPPEGVPPQDFRSPDVFRLGAWWYVVVGASLCNGRRQCLPCCSADGAAREAGPPLFMSPRLELGRMWECPNVLPLGGERWRLTVSVWPGLSAHAFFGRFDGERFIAESDNVLDDGDPRCLRVLLDGGVLEISAHDRLNPGTRVYPIREDSVPASAFCESDADIALQAWQVDGVFPQPRAEPELACDARGAVRGWCWRPSRSRWSLPVRSAA